MIIRSSGALVALFLGACGTNNSPTGGIAQSSESTPETSTMAGEYASATHPPGELIEHRAFRSDYVQPRNITVWVPAGYPSDDDKKYPVIYAHDGQNLFDASLSYGGVEWGLDETASDLIDSDQIPAAIIVGIWNTDERWQEYAPQTVIESLSGDTSSEWLGPTLPDLKADAYLRFIVTELKPFIDETYQTATGPGSTHIMGSSMGGLISLYALAEYPDTFSRAAAVSIHWPLTEPEGAMAQQADAAMQAYLAASELDKTRQTIWFDHGTETLDAAYPPHAAAMQSWFRTQGWTDDQAMFRSFPGTDHSEAAWAARADQILTFLLAPDQSDG